MTTEIFTVTDIYNDEYYFPVKNLFIMSADPVSDVLCVNNFSIQMSNTEELAIFSKFYQSHKDDYFYILPDPDKSNAEFAIRLSLLQAIKKCGKENSLLVSSDSVVKGFGFDTYAKMNAVNLALIEALKKYD